MIGIIIFLSFSDETNGFIYDDNCFMINDCSGQLVFTVGYKTVKKLIPKFQHSSHSDFWENSFQKYNYLQIAVFFRAMRVLNFVNRKKIIISIIFLPFATFKVAGFSDLFICFQNQYAIANSKSKIF